MKIWIIGKRGMLGSTLFAYFCSQKYFVSATSKHQTDITSYEQLQSFFLQHRPTHIMNCSAYTQVDLAEKNSAEAYLLNVEGVKNLARLSQEYGCKIIHFSTDYIFSGDKKAPYTEEDKGRPLNCYGKTKYEGERALLQLAKDFLIMRISWLYGKGSNHFPYKLMQMLQNKEQIKIVSDQRGRLTYCWDVAAALEQILDCSGIYHFANAGEVSWYEVAKYIWEKYKKEKSVICKTLQPVLTKDFCSAAERPLYAVLDTQKIERLLHFPIRHWSTALDEYLQYAMEKTVS